jgi:hypothetical protein
MDSDDDSKPPRLDPLVRNYLRVAGVVLIAAGCATVILFWYATHYQGDISPELRAEMVRNQRADPHAHPYIADLFVTAIAVYLIAGGVSALAGKSWALRWFFAFLSIFLVLALLVKKWG